MLMAGETKEQAIQRAILTKVVDNTDPAHAEFCERVFDGDSVLVYNGYVDDERNTDNAWIETTAMTIFVSDEHDVVLLDKTSANQHRATWHAVDDLSKMYGNHAYICLQAQYKLEQRGKLGRDISEMKTLVDRFIYEEERRSMTSVLLATFFKNSNLRSCSCTVLIVAFVRGWYESLLMESTPTTVGTDHGDFYARTQLVNGMAGLVGVLMVVGSDRRSTRTPHYLVGMALMAAGILVVFSLSVHCAPPSPNRVPMPLDEAGYGYGYVDGFADGDDKGKGPPKHAYHCDREAALGGLESDAETRDWYWEDRVAQKGGGLLGGRKRLWVASALVSAGSSACLVRRPLLPMAGLQTPSCVLDLPDSSVLPSEGRDAAVAAGGGAGACRGPGTGRLGRPGGGHRPRPRLLYPGSVAAPAAHQPPLCVRLSGRG
jgi:hypothetical protein